MFGGGTARSLLAALLVAACNGERSSPATARDASPVVGGTVVIVAQSDLDYMNPFLSQDRYTQEIQRFVLYLPLLRYGPKLEYQPALARTWDVVDDTAIVFHLRNDVFWHDSVRTTAHDVAFTYQRATDPATAFANADWFEGWTGVTVVDSFTVRFKVRRMADVLAGIPMMPIAPRHILDTIPPERMRQASFNYPHIGNGPFRFAERRDGLWIFDANRSFPAELGGRPRIDRLVWRVVPDGMAEITELVSGAAHMALGARVEQAVELAKDSAYQLVQRESRQYGFVGWNGKRAPFQDARVRRAFTLAMNRQRMIDLLRAGYGSIANGPVGRYHWAYDADLAPLPYAPDSARALLRSAGIEDRNGDGTLDRPDGRPLIIELKLPASSDFNRDLAELVRSDLQAIGVRMEIRPTEYGVLVGDITARERRFDAVLLGWESDFRLTLRSTFHSAARNGPFQFASFSHPAVDSIIDRTATMTDRNRALPELHRLQQILRDEQPWSFLYFYPDVYIASRALRDVEMDIRGALVNVARWWLQPSAAGAGAK